ASIPLPGTTSKLRTLLPDPFASTSPICCACTERKRSADQVVQIVALVQRLCAREEDSRLIFLVRAPQLRLGHRSPQRRDELGMVAHDAGQRETPGAVAQVCLHHPIDRKSLELAERKGRRRHLRRAFHWTASQDATAQRECAARW